MGVIVSSVATWKIALFDRDDLMRLHSDAARLRSMNPKPLHGFLQALVLLVFLCCSANAQSQTLFFQPPTYPGSGQVVTADLNGDGKADLVFADGTVLLGNADGTLHTGTPWGIGSQNFANNSIAIADVNGDGKPDLLVSAQNTLYVLLGKGDGTFQSALSSTTGAAAGLVLVSDINRDGKPDVVTLSGTTLLTFLGRGDGTFSSGIAGPVLANGLLLGVGDFNGDGKPDLLVSPVSGQLGVLLGNGDGTFQSSIITTSVSGFFPTISVLADINGDGKLDIIAADNFSNIVVLLGTGNGTFTQGPSIPQTGVSGLAVADVNGDGKPDLVFDSSGVVNVFLGNGDGTFAMKDTYFDAQLITLSPSTPLIIADFNGDGKADLAAAGALLLGNGDGTFAANAASLTPFGLGLSAVGDFNQDGNPDIASVAGTGLVSILLGDGTGRFPVQKTFSLPPQPIGPNFFPTGLTAVDLNGDGKPDLVLATADPNAQTWTVYVMLGSGGGNFNSATSAAHGTSNDLAFVQMVVGDFNGDHKPDLAVLDPAGDVNIFLGNGDGTFASSGVYFVGSQPTSLLTGDFNNDGKLDLVAAGGTAGLAVLLGKGDGSFGPVTFVDPTVTAVQAADDLNGDGALDLIARPQILLGNGDGTFRLLPAQLPASTVVTSVIDINGDGKLDIVGAEESRAGKFAEYLLGNGDGTFNAPVVLVTAQTGVGTTLGSILTADFNQDGRPDIAIGAGAAAVTLLNIGQVSTPDFLISASLLSPAIVSPGNSSMSTVTLTAIDAFAGAVNLSCSGLPTGATCTFSPTSLTVSGTSTLTITTSSAIPVGTYPVGVVGTGTTLTHSVTLTMTVATSTGATGAAVAPASLTFGPQAIGTTSSPQSIDLTNTGTGTSQLTVTAVSLTGLNPGDFAISNNGCTVPLAAGASCPVSLTFTPTGMASRSATLSISDNGTGSPQFVNLTGAGPDFSFSVSSAATSSVSPGKTATYSLVLAPTFGSSQTIAFTCTGAPALSTCSVSPNPASLSGTATTTATVTVSTTAGSSIFTPRTGPPIAEEMNQRLLSLLFLFFATISVAVFVLSRWGNRGRWAPALSLVVLIVAGLLLASCGGGSAGTSTSPGTAAGTYTLSVTGTATSNSSPATHTVNLTLTVQ